MDLMHNSVFRILAGDNAGLYRVVLDEIQRGYTIIVRLDPVLTENQPRRGRKKLETIKNKRRKAPASLVGKLIFVDRSELQALVDQKQLLYIQVETELFQLSPSDEPQFKRRCEIMKGFLDFDNVREKIIIDQNISGLIDEAITNTEVSKPLVYKLFSLLCRFGFHESSLRPRRDRCGAKGIARPCDPSVRQKPGAKTTKQRVARAYGQIIPPQQPGMNTEWRNLIMTADKQIPTPKPAMPARTKLILASAFVKKYRQDGNKLVAVDPTLGEYPNNRQIRRVLETEVSKLQQLLDKTTKGHFARSIRGLMGKNWQGVAGPGHTWAIDSTIGDIYLRSSVNRAWIIGRPIVYIIVDVWSTAVVGFYVCLTGPSWDTAKVSLFCSAAPPEFLGELWGYQPMMSLSPSPTMCAALMCDRGEYLSKAASLTGAKLIPCLSYAPPYRPDLKGLVEVLHRIEKDRQFLFVPGAIDMRRQEFELRKFNPNEAVLTVREYTQYLYTIFTEYNLTADRTHRVDAHMKAIGVFPSPAGLWRWGHEMGIGVRRDIPLSELITNLLPSEQARVTRNGVMFAGKQYGSDVVDEQQWTAYARNFGGWDIGANHFPGSVSKIWVPNPTANGLLDLNISDYSTASPELTFDEVADAFMFGKINNAEVQHAKTLHALQSLRKVQEIVASAKILTDEALARYSGAKPSMTETRAFETSTAQSTPTSATASGADSSSSCNNDDAYFMHMEMMSSVLAAVNGMENSNV
ncbi:MAG: transposase [Nitrosomonadales bacterium]|nr:transposase [Nitrosomonadales bacterium]